MDIEDKRKERNRRYYEKKRQTVKVETVNNNFIDFELIPKAKELALKVMSDNKDSPDFIHSFIEYIEVEYTRFYQLELERNKQERLKIDA